MRRILLALAMLLAAVGLAQAHHSRAMFDLSRNLTYRGVVVEYRWQNPHSHIVIAVAPGAEDPATVGTWEVEASAIGLMINQGWSPTTYKSGDPITLVVHPARSATRNLLLFYAIRPDGTRLFRANHRYESEVE